MNDEGLKLAATTFAAMFSAAFTIATLVLQINGYPSATIFRMMKSDSEMIQSIGILFAILWLQIVGVTLSDSCAKTTIVRLNPILAFIQLSVFLFLIYKIISYLDVRTLSSKLGQELADKETNVENS